MMKWMALAVAALATLPCRAADKPDAGESVESRADVAQEVLALTGSRTKIVWVHRVAGTGEDLDGKGPEWELMGLDTADGKMRVILPGPASYMNPCISPDGEKVFFTDGGSNTIYSVNWDGSNRREFTKGMAQSPWRHPTDGSQWLYFNGEHGVVRARMDDASVRETVWKAGLSNFRIVSVSADGARMGGNDAAGPGVAVLPDVSWRQCGGGCSPCIAPDNSYRFFHMGTEVGHGGVRIYDDGGKNPRGVWFRGGKGGLPGIEGNAWSHEARWSTDPRFFTVFIEGRLPAAKTCDIYLGRFDEGFTKVASWVRITDAPARNGRPYCWIDPGLGSYEGEAPLTIAVPGTLTPGGEWAWDYGDGSQEQAAQGKHTYAKAGGYRITATQGQKKLSGWANVRPQKPPAVTGGALAVDESHVLVRFDERVQLKDAKATLGSGGVARGLKLDPAELDLLVELDKPVGAADTMTLSGVFDKAQAPNALAQAPIRITRPGWPSDRSGLIYLFEGSRADNTIWDPASGLLSATLKARFDRHGAILCRGATIEPPWDGTKERLLGEYRKSQVLTLEMVVQTADLEQQGPAEAGGMVPFLSLEGGSGLWAGQEKQKLVVRLGGPDPKDPVRLFDAGTLPDDKPHHLVIAYRPKQLVCYLDGGKTLDADPSPAQLRWDGNMNPLLIGCGKAQNPSYRDGGGSNTLYWRGRMEGIAMYKRFVEEAEVARNFAAYGQKLAARTPVASVAVRAKLLARSAVPSAADIAPYTRALVVCEYQVEEVTRGTLEEKVVRVARWGLMDAQPAPAAREELGKLVSLTLESYTDHDELVQELLRDTLPENFELKLWVEAE